MAHLAQVHGPFMGAGIDLRHVYSRLWSVLKHNWFASWEPEENDKHVGTLKLTHKLGVCGKIVDFLDLHVEAKQVRLCTLGRGDTDVTDFGIKLPKLCTTNAINAKFFLHLTRNVAPGIYM